MKSQQQRLRPNRITIRVGTAEQSIPVTFSDEEYEVLDLFIEQSDALERTKWVKRGEGVLLRINVEKGKTSFDICVPSEDLVAEALHRARPFLLQREPASFLRVASLVRKHLPSPETRGLLKRLCRRFLGKHFQSIIAITLTSRNPDNPENPVSAVLNSHSIFLDWLNAYEYHRDRDKRRYLDTLTGLSPEFAQAVFLGMLADAISAVLDLAILVATLSGHESRATFEFPHRNGKVADSLLT